VKRRKRLKEEVLGPYFDGVNPEPSDVYKLLHSPGYASLSRSIYPTGVQLRQLKRDLAAI
jgi:hypothetical protein